MSISSGRNLVGPLSPSSPSAPRCALAALLLLALTAGLLGREHTCAQAQGGLSLEWRAPLYRLAPVTGPDGRTYPRIQAGGPNWTRGAEGASGSSGASSRRVVEMMSASRWTSPLGGRATR